jgi:pyruvate,water dikinase
MTARPGEAPDKLIASLQERAKELNCLYEIEVVLTRTDLDLDGVFRGVVSALPHGWQHPDICRAVITFQGRPYRSQDFEPTPWMLGADIVVQDEVLGQVTVYYLKELPPGDFGPFLKEEVRLIKTVAGRLSHYVLFQRMQGVREDWLAVRAGTNVDEQDAWRVPMHLLRQSDKNLYLRIARKMLNHLCRIGVMEAQNLLPGATVNNDAAAEASVDTNVPGRRISPDFALLLTDRPFELAGRHLSGSEILERVQRWMQEDKAADFMRTLNNPRTSVPEIAEAIRRFHQSVVDGSSFAPSTLKSLRVSLTQRLLTEQLDFVRVAKDFVETTDFEELVDRIILPPESHGKLGGKSAGLILAHKILERGRIPDRPIGEIKVPKTYYVASDALLDFISYNDLQDVIEQKFKEVDQIRQEYSNVIQLFKNSSFPANIVTSLAAALDDLGDRPLIIRSSSLLEDRLGTAFSGKYKSLFLANQGTKQERMDALLDAIAEVYASTFGPDPIEYRRERGLLEFNEEMGILIQEVVGVRIGDYFLPAFAGVAFSNNEFRWSPRIKREDGLIRLVPGLGTRAVDRVPDDYPVLVVPGQPSLRANVAIDEIVRYSPKKLDAINLKTRTLDTLVIEDLLKMCGREYPAFDKVFSVLKDDMLKKPIGVLLDPERDELIATFEGLISGTPFLQHMGNIMQLLKERLETPVDIEFAHDGTDFYLLQCRPQSYGGDAAPAPIPKDVAREDVVFTANRYVSNGWMPDITHIVYVDPEKYGELGSRTDLLAIGRAVGRLNKLLPKRQFILMGPGRWGSRGDVKLGVSVTYADISNTAMLVEIARKKGGYLPDLSFGTHFFQDLVESRIRYLPLYPDDDGIVFNERFLRSAPNLLPEMLPDFAHLADTLHVIDVPAARDGRVLRVLMNADLDEAIGILSASGERGAAEPVTTTGTQLTPAAYWRWRLKMAERIAEETDPARFGVVAMYVFGSTKNAMAGPGSDIDLLVHFRGSEGQRGDLMLWLQGWSLCLAEINFLRTGYRSDGLLDAHLVTDEDIANRTSYAVKIGAVTDPARELPLGRKAASHATADPGRIR